MVASFLPSNVYLGLDDKLSLEMKTWVAYIVVFLADKKENDWSANMPWTELREHLQRPGRHMEAEYSSMIVMMNDGLKAREMANAFAKLIDDGYLAHEGEGLQSVIRVTDKFVAYCAACLPFAEEITDDNG